ncbi:unnamed protein product [Paramecium sonneborni]|uniref:Dynactin subunit P25 n=1 Tax=Paramecium sonneborni TaxID=65129 RepID=A0A8S1R4M4_9CILI|nr:unnamed protein product [Paramecium sonneborni]
MDAIIQYDKSEFHETSSGIKISKKSIIKGTEQINVSGRCIFFHDVILRGDLAKVSIGKYLVVHEKVTLKPSYTYGYTKESPTKKVIKFLPLMISDYVEIDSSSIIQASKIGTCTSIGKNCYISHRCIIGENSIILDDSILPPDTVVPANSVYGGRPAIYIAETPESTAIIQKQKLINFYKNFVPKS